MKKTEKHAAPLRCRIRRAITVPSPSAYAWCHLGLRQRTRQCKGCEHNMGEAMTEAFQAGLEEGRKIIEALQRDGHPLILQIHACDLSKLEHIKEEDQDHEPTP